MHVLRATRTTMRSGHDSGFVRYQAPLSKCKVVANIERLLEQDTPRDLQLLTLASYLGSSGDVPRWKEDEEAPRS